MEDICIAAPRPLRLFTPLAVVHRPGPPPKIPSAPIEAFARFSLSDDEPLPKTSTSPQSNPSPSFSPVDLTPVTTSPCDPSHTNARLGLPEETLEEFLAILRPPILVPPMRAPRRHHSAGTPWAYDRPHPYRVARKSNSSSSTITTTTTTTDGPDRKSRRGIGKLTRDRSETDTPLTTSIEDHHAADWLNFDLGSPISRTHTRNPLPRHPSYETLTSNLLFTARLSPLLRPSNNPIELHARISLLHPDPVDPAKCDAGLETIVLP